MATPPSPCKGDHYASWSLLDPKHSSGEPSPKGSIGLDMVMKTVAEMLTASGEDERVGTCATP